MRHATTILGAGLVLGLLIGPAPPRTEGREDTSPPYDVHAQLVGVEPGAARALLGWPVVRGTCRVERAVRPQEISYG
jgi:hypothetical protein